MKTQYVNNQIDKAIEPIVDMLVIAKDVKAHRIERDLERVLGILTFWRSINR